MTEFSDSMFKDRLAFLVKTIGIAGFGVYLTIKMKRVSLLNRLFFGSSN
jgi:hypothetical protein